MAKNGKAGYIVVKAPDDYPGHTYWGLRYVQEHVLVWWKNTGHVPAKGEHVHHKNENKGDNRFSNLELLTAADHAKRHSKPPALIRLQCSWCNASFTRSLRNVRVQLKQGQKNFYCSRSHQVQAQQVARRETRGIPLWILLSQVQMHSLPRRTGGSRATVAQAAKLKTRVNSNWGVAKR